MEKKEMIKPVIKWSGSKRSQSERIKEFFPTNIETYYEPFIGGGSMLYTISPHKSICGDICKPLISLWEKIKNNPSGLAEEYAIRWNRLQTEGHQAYYDIRDKFNQHNNPDDLLFLSRTCVNGLIRFNSNGEFNNSLHHTRPGISPDKLKTIILDWSQRIQNTEFYAQDYKLTTSTAQKGDLIYLDPPYYHTKGRYYGTGTIDFNEFFDYLASLNDKGVKYILSFDGKRNTEDYTINIPSELYLHHELIASGNSSFKKVMDKEKQQVYESLYLNF